MQGIKKFIKIVLFRILYVISILVFDREKATTYKLFRSLISYKFEYPEIYFKVYHSIPITCNVLLFMKDFFMLCLSFIFSELSFYY